MPVEVERSEAPELDHDAIGFKDGLALIALWRVGGGAPVCARRGLETAPDDRF